MTSGETTFTDGKYEDITSKEQYYSYHENQEQIGNVSCYFQQQQQI
jgi:hypothetical protein